MAFLAVDEIQLATDLDRGHVFTDRLLNAAAARRRCCSAPPPCARSRAAAGRLDHHAAAVLAARYAGDRKITRLPPRTAIVAFSADEVYAIAELIRRQRGGAAVVMGALSPRTRNAQVEMYQNGEVDYLVATDAIGMGLNLDVDHVAFAADRKFDGHQSAAHSGRARADRRPRRARHAQRHVRHHGAMPPFEEEMVNALENHPSTASRCCNGAMRAGFFLARRACRYRSR